MAINEQSFKAELSRVFKDNGLGSLLNIEKSDAFYRLTIRMLEENEKYNLTAITEPKRIILQHYADCATLAAHLPKGAKLCDVGCGAGFPSLVLAILRDGNNKAVELLAAMQIDLGLLKQQLEQLNVENSNVTIDEGSEQLYKVLDGLFIL